jgi:hypothetical protein
MNGLIVFVVIVVLSAVIGAVSQVLKNQQQAEQARAARARAANRGGDADRDRREGRSSGDIDRFLEEIDKLRRKSAAGGKAEPPSAAPVAKRATRPTADVPTVERTRKPRLADEPDRSFPAPSAVGDRPPPTSRPTPPPRLEDLPVAPVIGPAVPPLARAAVTAPPRPATSKTEFGKQLAALLGSKTGVPMAVVLQEVLGPPKCKRG